MSVDRNEKIWAWSNTGSKIHAFVSPAGDGKLRAMCRKNTTRNADAVFLGQDETSYPTYVCTRCLTLANEMWDRAEASMGPATETHDLGYVAPVDERAEAVRIPADMNRELLRQAQAVAEAHKRLFPKSPVQGWDALHAEAIEMDELETAKADLIGRTFRPTWENACRHQDDRITPTRLWQNQGGEVCVAYDIQGLDWQGRSVISHSALKVSLFRQLYRAV